MGKAAPVVRGAGPRGPRPRRRPTATPTPTAPRVPSDASPTPVPAGTDTASDSEATPPTASTGVPAASPTAPPAAAALALPPPLDPAARSITLEWVAPVDLDLYVTGPDARTTYFGSPSAPNGTLDADADCASALPRRERIDLAANAVGTFRIGVDASDDCATPHRPIAYRVLADLAGERTEATGTLANGAFVPEALVVTVPAATEPAR